MTSKWKWHRIALIGAASLVLSACVGNGDDEGTPPAFGGQDFSWAAADPGDPQTDANEAMLRYLTVIRAPANRDDCLDPALPDRCPTGPRSGTRTGAAVHEWMRRVLDAIPGMQDVEQQRFDVPRFAPTDWRIVVPGGTGSADFVPASLPWFFRGLTPADGVTGPLLDIGNGGLLSQLLSGDVAGRVVVFQGELRVNAEAPSVARTLERLSERGAAGAVVFFADAPANEIVAQNYDSRLGLGSLPTLLVGKEDGRRLQQLAGQQARLVLSGEYRDGPRSVPASAAARTPQSTNTIAWLPGVDESRWIVIGTPLNSWLIAGGERAPGVAVFIHLARHLAKRVREEGPLPYPVYFAATGGHEILQFGLQRFLGCVDPERVGAYVHAGAGLVSRKYDRELLTQEPIPRNGLHQTRTLSISENLLLRLIANPPFTRAELQPLFDLPPVLFNPGEARVAWQAGIPLVSISGTNPYHHTRLDDERQFWQPAVGPMMEAYTEVVDGLLDANLDAIRLANLVADLVDGPPPDELSCAGMPAGFR